jgi:hypothetical protein
MALTSVLLHWIEMMLLEKQIVLSERMKGNLFLLPGVVLLGCALLAESCSSRKSIGPASETGSGAVKVAGEITPADGAGRASHAAVSRRTAKFHPRGMAPCLNCT